MSLQQFEPAGTALMMEKASLLGFSFKNPDWVNFGQGTPDLGFIPGDLERLKQLDLSQSQGYTPVAGLPVLRQKIAEYYNHTRELSQNPESKNKQNNLVQLDKNNVNISSAGGRGALFKVFASLKEGLKIGYLNPDYTAYKGLFQLFPKLEFKTIDLDPQKGFQIGLEIIKKTIEKENLEAIFFSNPSNPTGQKLTESELSDFLQFCNLKNCLVIHDEFYSKFSYDSQTPIFSAFNHIENIEKSNLIIVDGLTKGWRYPGFRMSWIISRKENIKKINNLSSVIDGGLSHPIQLAALNLFQPEKIKQQSKALQENFNLKREYLLENLLELGFKIKSAPQGAFYIFAGIDKFLNQYKDDLDFASQLLKQKIIVIPGRFFDINLNSKQPKWTNFVRFSYGLEMDKIKQGVLVLKQGI